ncbi:MAG: hypothetical protein ACO395_07620 [Pontimonas sp.]
MNFLVFISLMLSLLVSGCVSDRGKVASNLQAVADGTNTLALSLETPHGNKLTVTGAQTLTLDDNGLLSMRGLATGSYLTNLTHNRTSFMGGASESGLDGRTTDPDEAVVGAAGTALGNVIKTVVTP